MLFQVDEVVLCPLSLKNPFDFTLRVFPSSEMNKKKRGTGRSSVSFYVDEPIQI
jgi:hypothetical protein